MSEEYRKIFVQKLNYYMSINNKTQMDLMKDLNLSSATVSSWCTGKKLPRMDKVQKLADYFGITKSDLIENKTENTSTLKIVELYNQLNVYGKEEAEKRVKELTYVPQYTAKDNILNKISTMGKIENLSKEQLETMLKILSEKK